MSKELSLQHKADIKHSLVELLVKNENNTTVRIIEKAQKLYEFIAKQQKKVKYNNENK